MSINFIRYTKKGDFNIIVLNDLIKLFKKKGFRDVYQVLMQYKDYKVDKHTFYNDLNKFSYYNSFFRVKDELIKKGLIEIEQNNKVKYIKLTNKGLDIYNKLSEIDTLINNH